MYSWTGEIQEPDHTAVPSIAIRSPAVAETTAACSLYGRSEDASHLRRVLDEGEITAGVRRYEHQPVLSRSPASPWLH